MFGIGDPERSRPEFSDRPVNSQSRMSLSVDPTATTLRPSGENATWLSRFVHPSSPASCSPVAALQRRTIPSLPAEASTRPSGEKATAFVPRRCPAITRHNCPDRMSHMRMPLSCMPTVASAAPSGENATDATGPHDPFSTNRAHPLFYVPQVNRPPVGLLAGSQISAIR